MSTTLKRAGKVIGIALCACLAVMCNRQSPPEDARTARGQPPPSAVPVAPQSREQPARRPPPAPAAPDQKRNDVISLAPRPAPSGTAETRPAAPLAGESELFASSPQQRLMAEDFKIGALQDGITSSRDSSHALASAGKFLDSVAGGKVDYSLVLPAVTAEIKSVVAYPMAQGYVPRRYRIGRFSFEGERELRANIRLYKDQGVTEGEIYLTKADDEWKVSDLQAGFTLLARVYERPGEPFVPGSYKFLLDHR